MVVGVVVMPRSNPELAAKMGKRKSNRSGLPCSAGRNAAVYRSEKRSRKDAQAGKADRAPLRCRAQLRTEPASFCNAGRTYVGV